MAAPTSFRVLIADDEPAVRFVLKVALELEGHQVTEAGDGVEALRLHGAEDFDVIVTDFMMPVMTGAELIEKVREQDPGVPIIMISSSPEARQSSDPDVFIEKPFNPSDLAAHIARLLVRA